MRHTYHPFLVEEVKQYHLAVGEDAASESRSLELDEMNWDLKMKATAVISASGDERPADERPFESEER